MTKLTPILETAKQILNESRKPMHVRELAEVAVRTNRNFQLDAEMLADRFAAALAANLNTKSPSFGKVKNKQGGLKKGIYRLKASEIAPRVSAKNSPEPPAINTNFMGKAGEHAVMSELLFWGYNASLMSVDEGIDIVASKGNQYFHLQVKSCADTDGSRFSFKIKNSAFNMHNAANTFYILVMRKRGGSDFAVLPSSHISNLRGLGVIGGTGDLNMVVAADQKRRTFALNGTDDITLFINNFGLIK